MPADHDVSRQQSLESDHLGGACLRHARPHVQLQRRLLRALDIHHSPDLETLDLRGCPTGLHIGIRHAPRLTRIRLPDDGTGAVMHIEGQQHAPVLTVEGAVDEIDACWKYGRFRLVTHGRPPWQGVAINTRGTRSTEAAVIAGDADLARHLMRRNRALRDLHLLDVALPERLRLDRLTRLHALHLTRCQGASKFRLPERLQRLVLREHPDICRIDGGGRVLHAKRCRATSCTVSGVWSQVLFERTPVWFLDAPLARAVELRGDPGVGTLSITDDVRLTVYQSRYPALQGAGVFTPKRGGDRAIDHLLRRLAAGDNDVHEALWRLLAEPAKPAEWLHRLLALAGAIGTLAPATLWQLRCRLHAAQLMRLQWEDDAPTVLRKAGRRWRWHFPTDRSREGYTADLELAAVAADTSEASPFFELLQAIDQPEQLAAVADAVQHARNRGETPLPAFVTALHAGTPRACRHLRRRRRAVTTDYLLTLVHGAVLVGDADGAEAIRRFATEQCDASAQLRVLLTLVDHGCRRARSDLWQLATATTDDALRQRAQRGALTPARTTALAPNNTEEIAHD